MQLPTSSSSSSSSSALGFARVALAPRRVAKSSSALPPASKCFSHPLTSSSASTYTLPYRSPALTATLPSGMQRQAVNRTRSGIPSSTFSMDDDVRAKTRACAGETSAAAASRIIAQWATRRRQACEQMVLTTLDLDRRDRESELLALARLHAVSMLDASFLRAADDHVEVGRHRARSPERALVRRIAREWAASPRGAGEGAARGRGEEWMGETERERVRSVRERVRMASQGGPDQRPTRDREGEPPRLRADAVTRRAMERQRELQGLSEHRAVSAFAHRGRIQSVLRGRFFRSGRPMNDERPISVAARELGQLRQSHPDSRLREEVRFLTERVTSDQATSGALTTQNSSANNEHDSVTPQVASDDNHHIENATRSYEIQTHQPMQDEAVHIESIVPDGNDVLQNDFAQEQIRQYEEYSDSGSSEQDSGQSGSASSTASSSSIQQEAETYGQQTDLQWSRDISVSEDGHDSAFLHRDEEWHVTDSLEGEQLWQSGRSFSSSRNINRFSPPDDDVYGVELRELLSRLCFAGVASQIFSEAASVKVWISSFNLMFKGKNMILVTGISMDRDQPLVYSTKILLNTGSMNRVGLRVTPQPSLQLRYLGKHLSHSSGNGRLSCPIRTGVTKACIGLNLTGTPSIFCETS
ncbi:uncharacterized protein LOC133917128 isoform X2 [Phragmites australis]|uniref:uncharacterized protein LOC133917128 isoform X2 n=1 Tax=Phragmites australis TaxID=29695 RepID=UPI002D783525|nr:uncharacterized protein LOC133917128 isoform X2 [Phragmites australis]